MQKLLLLLYKYIKPKKKKKKKNGAENVDGWPTKNGDSQASTVFVLTPNCM